MRMNLTNLIRSYFLIQKDKEIPVEEKNILLNRIKRISGKKYNKKQIRNQAISEILTCKNNLMYKLFLQCIILNGKIE